LKDLTIGKLLNWARDILTEADIENPGLNAELITSHVLNLKRLDLYLKSGESVELSQKNLIHEMLDRRCKEEPLQYILGETEFYGYKFFVDPSVLIPRPETEYLVEKVITSSRQAKSILEIGTGSGCISISLIKNLTQATVTATDLYSEALEMAKRNAELNNVSVRFLCSDIYSQVTGKYDVIVSNPPYIRETDYRNLPAEIKKYEPGTALLANEDGLFFYRKILEKAGKYLNKNGKIYLEIGHDQADKIKLIAEKNDFRNIELIQDLNGFDRIMILG